MGYTDEEVEDCWVNRESRKLLRALSASVGVGLNDDGGAVRRGGCLPFPFVCTGTELKWDTVCNGKVNVPWEGKQLSRTTALPQAGFAKDERVESRPVMPHGRLLEDRMSQRWYNSYLHLARYVHQTPKGRLRRVEDVLLPCHLRFRGD
jgi:hypothetical protein